MMQTSQLTVKEGLGEIRHRVALRKADYEWLSGGKTGPEALLSESFRNYDHRRRQVLDSLCDKFQRWKAGDREPARRSLPGRFVLHTATLSHHPTSGAQSFLRGVCTGMVSPFPAAHRCLSALVSGV
jgi:hypothetical protein